MVLTPGPNPAIEQFVGGAKTALERVLTKHKSDFEDWRYLYELKDGTSVNFLDLLVATEAMISNFDAISIDESTSDVNVKMANRIHGIVENE